MKKLLALILALILTFVLCGCDSRDYKEAGELYEVGKYQEAAEIFAALGDYENSQEMYQASLYMHAIELFDASDYDKAWEIFSELGNFEDSQSFLKECEYQKAEALFAAGSYEEAIAIYEPLADYNDSREKIRTAERELMFERYGQAIELLTQGVWFANGGLDAAVNRFKFTEESALIYQIYYDGNGKHAREETSNPYIINGTHVVITLIDGSEVEIPYALEADGVKLGNGDYFTIEEIEAALQGDWNSKESNNIFGIVTKNEYNIRLNQGIIEYEYAALAYGGRNGEYYYYGPHSGTYTITEGGMNADVRNGMMFGFGIVNGEVVLMRYENACRPGTGFKGQNGYSF